MKEDAAAKELEDLLRDALETAAPPHSTRQPQGSMRTMPLPFTPAPAQPLATSGNRIDVALKHAEEDPDDIPRLAVDAFATSPPQEKKSRAGLFAVLGVALVAVAAGGAAFWKTKHATPAAPAVVAQAAPVATTTASEGAVGFAVAARPADAPPAAEPKPDEAVGAATIAKADVVAKPEPVVAAPAPPPPAARPAAVVAAAPKAEPRPVVAAPTPAPRPVVVAPPPAAKPEPRPAPPPVVAAAPPPAPKPEPPPRPVAAPQPASVDAILQQQLKGAIP